MRLLKSMVTSSNSMAARHTTAAVLDMSMMSLMVSPDSILLHAFRKSMNGVVVVVERSLRVSFLACWNRVRFIDSRIFRQTKIKSFMPTVVLLAK